MAREFFAKLRLGGGGTEIDADVVRARENGWVVVVDDEDKATSFEQVLARKTDIEPPVKTGGKTCYIPRLRAARFGDLIRFLHDSGFPNLVGRIIYLH